MTIDPLIRPILGEQVAALAALVRDPERSAAYTVLAGQVEAGEVTAEHVESLERVLEISLQTGRVRNTETPQIEKALLSLYHRTPTGKATVSEVRETNEALAALAGQQVESLKFSASIPGTYRIALETDKCDVSIEIDRDGVRVRNIAVGV